MQVESVTIPEAFLRGKLHDPRADGSGEDGGALGRARALPARAGMHVTQNVLPRCSTRCLSVDVADRFSRAPRVTRWPPTELPVASNRAYVPILGAMACPASARAGEPGWPLDRGRARRELPSPPRLGRSSASALSFNADQSDRPNVPILGAIICPHSWGRVYGSGLGFTRSEPGCSHAVVLRATRPPLLQHHPRGQGRRQLSNFNADNPYKQA